jgi:hypothetical protein
MTLFHVAQPKTRSKHEILVGANVYDITCVTLSRDASTATQTTFPFLYAFTLCLYIPSQIINCAIYQHY